MCLIKDALAPDISQEEQGKPGDETAFRDLHKKSLEEDLVSKKQDREQRKEFAAKIFSLTVGWLVCVVLILLFQGWGIAFSCVETDRFHLSDSVLIALITGASVNIIGLMAIVIRYLFPPTSKSK